MRLLLAILALLTGSTPPLPADTTAIPPRVAVLVYHQLDTSGSPGTVAPEQFAAHLEMLRDEGYHILHPDEFAAYMAGLLEIPDRSVLITFDDGYESLYTEAYPLLQKYQAPAMAFIITHWFDYEGPWLGLPHLTREQGQELAASGLISLQVHTHNQHLQLPGQTQDATQRSALAAPVYRPELGRQETPEEYKARVRADLRQARKVLAELGVPPISLVHFAPPYGDISPELLAVAHDEGFRLFYGTHFGLTGPGDRQAIPRYDAGEPWVSAETLKNWLAANFASR